MKLCHVITINADQSVSHGVVVKTIMDNHPPADILMPPTQIDFTAYGFCAVKAPQLVLNNFDLLHDGQFELTLTVVDDLEKRPTLHGHGQVAALVLVSECIKSLAEGLISFGFEPRSFKKSQANELVIDFTLSKDSSAFALVGGLLCLLALIDTIFFERGLVATPHLAIKSPVLSENNLDFLKDLPWFHRLFLNHP